jgi:hypothetical protein
MSIEPMDWLICVVLGHNYMYQCDMTHPTLQNHRKCKTCGKEQTGTAHPPNSKLVWKDYKHE